MTGIHVKGEWLSFLRKAKGISQSKLSTDTCSIRKLSDVENGNSDVSDKLFEALMARMGYQVSAVPSFASKDEFETLMKLNTAHDMILNFNLGRAKSILDDISPEKKVLTKICLQKWIAFYSMIHIFEGNTDGQIMKNLVYALSLSGKKEIPDGPCYIGEAGIYLLISILLIMTDENDKASYLLDRLKLFCPYVLDDSDYIYNHIYTYFIGLEFIAKDALADDYHDIDKAVTYAKVHDDCLGVMLLSFAEAKLCLKKGDWDNYKKQIYVTIDMAEYMNCPFKSFVYRWINRHSSADRVLLMNTYEVHKDLYPAIIEATNLSSGEDSSNPYNIWDLIRDTRIERGISALKLADGLCSQSKLSKMELNKQGCDCLLIHSLLQRLDIEDRYFVFFVSQKESDIYQCMLKIVYYMNQRDKNESLNFGNLQLSKQNNMHRQLVLVYKSYVEADYRKRISILKDALKCTRREKAMEKIGDGYFTDIEWKCIIDIVVLYCIEGRELEFNKYYFAIKKYLEMNVNLNDFKRKYAAIEMYHVLTREHNFHMARYWDDLLYNLRPKISYKNYAQSLSIETFKE